MIGRFAEKVLPWCLSAGIHLAVLGLLSVSFSFHQARPAAPVQVAMKATVVDESRIQSELAKLEEQDRQRQRQQEAERDLLEKEANEARVARQREEERLARVEQERVEAQEQAATEQRQREQQESEQRATAQRLAEERAAKEEARLAELAQQRKAEEARLAEAERLRKAEEARRREEEQRLAAITKQRAEEETRRRAAEEAREMARLRSELAESIAAEERQRHAEQSGLLDQYRTLIKQKVERNWVRPPSAASGIVCEVRVRQIPGGDVVDVRFGQCNADASVSRSIEAAVYKASPLPPPPDPTLFDRDIVFRFEPE